MPPSTRARCDLGDGLALRQSHSHRLSGEEVVVLQLRGAWVVVFPWGYEGNSGRRIVLSDLCQDGSWEGGKNNSDTRGLGIWGCVSRRGVRFTPYERSRVLHRLGTRSWSCVDISLPRGSNGVGGVKEADRGIAWEVVYTTECFAMGSACFASKEERW